MMDRIIVDDNVSAYYALLLNKRMDDLSQMKGRVSSLSDTELESDTIVEAIGAPEYVDNVMKYSEYNLTETGWYVFARIMTRKDETVPADVQVEGAAGYIAEPGADHVDVAVRFDVAAESQRVQINWGDATETFIFKATDLAIRNLDYRTTFYVYDIAPYATWEYAFTADTTFAADKKYFVKNGDTYEAAEVQTVAYQLTADETFQAGKTYYTKGEDDAYTAAEVTTGEAVTADTYYEQTTVPVPAYYEPKETFALTTDQTFIEGKTYYTLVDGQYVAATVTAGEAVTANTYYEASTGYVRTEDQTFVEGKTYYVLNSGAYEAATVTAGEAVPAYYNHSKLIFSGMARNITYQFNEVVDCPQVYVLPEIEDDTHGCWFEIRLRHNGSFSSTLQVPEGVKVATEHTQAETAGLNMVDLHYSNVGGVKLWRFLNTHSTIPS